MIRRYKHLKHIVDNKRLKRNIRNAKICSHILIYFLYINMLYHAVSNNDKMLNNL